MRRLFSILITLAGVGIWPGSTSLAQNILVLGGQGDPAPDGNGFLGPISIFALSEGAAAYSVRTTGSSLGDANDNLLVTASWRGIETVFREGDAAPSNGRFGGTVGQISVNSLAKVAFYGYLTGTSQGTLNDEGIFAGNGTSITQIVRENQAEPAGGPGVFNSFGVPDINIFGQVAFWGAIRNTGTPLTSTHGLFVGSGGALTQIARTYTAAHDGNGQIRSLSGQKISNTGWVAYNADLTGTNNGSLDDHAIFMGNGITTRTIARENDLAPGGNGRLDTFSIAALNDNNLVAFYSSLRGTSGGSSDNGAIFRGSGSALTKIARLGDTAARGGTYTDLNRSISINSLGDVAFIASVSTGDGVFWSNGTTSKAIARAGDATPEGQGTFTGFTLASINNTRTVAFQAELSRGANYTGLYLGDGTETLLIARVGDTLNGSTIKSLGFDPKTFNDFRQLAFQAVLANGSVDVYLFSPEIKWRLNGNGSWADDTRWTVSLRPGEYTQVEIDPEAGGTISGPDEDTTIRSLRLGGTTSGVAELNINRNGAVTILEGAQIDDGGLLTGNGEIIGDIVNNGTVAPGNSPGDIDITGGYTQTSAGTLVLQVGGTDDASIDHLNVNADISLAGTLELQLIDGFLVEYGMVFDLVNGRTITLDNLSLIMPTLSEGLFIEHAILNDIDREILRFSVVPEPATIALIGLGAFIFLYSHRRKNTSRPL